MTAVFSLVKAQFRQGFRVDSSNRYSKSAKIGMIAAFIILGIIFIPMFTAAFWMAAKTLHGNGMDRSYFAMIFTLAQGIAFIFGTLMLVSTLFFSKDSEFLMTLPVRAHTVFVAKLLYVYVNELLFAGSIALLGGIVFGIVTSGSVFYFLLLPLAVLLVPLLPLLLSSALIIPVMYFIGFLKGKTTLTVALMVVAFAAFFYFYMSFVGNAQSFDPSQGEIEISDELLLVFEKLANAMFFNAALGDVLLLGDRALSGLLTVLVTYALAGSLAVLLASLGYKKGLSIQMEGGEEKMKARTFTETGLKKALFFRELKSIMRTPNLAFYCIMPVVMAPLMTFFMQMTTTMEAEGMTAAEMAEMSKMIGAPLSIFFLLMFIAGMNYAALSAFTREGESFVLLKTFPVPYEEIVEAKANVGTLFYSIAIVVTLPFLIWQMQLSVLDAALVSGFVFIMGYGYTRLQVRLDLDKPSLHWDTLAHGLKNNHASLVSMFSAMGIGIALMVVMMVKNMMLEGTQFLWVFDLLLWVLMYAGAILFAYLASRKLEKKAAFLFEKVEP